MANFFNPSGAAPAAGIDPNDLYRRQAASQDAALAALLAKQNADRDQQALIDGTFADRAQQQERMARLGYVHDAEMGRQTGDYHIQGLNIANQPALGRLDLDKTKYTNEWQAGAPGRALSDAEAALELNLIPKAAAPNPMGAVFNDMGSGNALVGNSGGMPTKGAAPLTQDQAIAQYAAYQRAKRGEGPIGPTEQELYNRAQTRDSADTQAFSTMAASTDPRVRAIGIAGLQKTRSFSQLPAGVVQGLNKPLASTGEDFLVQPAVVSEIKAIGTELAAAGNDTNAEELALALKPRVDHLVARATENGADPNQVLQAILGQLAKAAPASSFYTNPITTTLGAIPGVRDFIPTPSRDAARSAIGIR